jgi:hypothetical protein
MAGWDGVVVVVKDQLTNTTEYLFEILKKFSGEKKEKKKLNQNSGHEKII